MLHRPENPTRRHRTIINPYGSRSPTVTWAKYLITHPSPRLRESALDFVEESLARVEKHHNHRLSAMLRVLRALALDARRDRSAALDSLTKTLRYAKSRCLVRTIVDCGPGAKVLLDELSTGPSSGDYVEALRAAFRPTAAETDAVPALTHAERETVELLARRMTNKEIAVRLAVSPAAVKKRLERIYDKLAVNDRLEAAEQAVARGLIDPPSL